MSEAVETERPGGGAAASIFQAARRAFWCAPGGPAVIAAPLHWRGDGGFAQLFQVGFPLVLGAISGAVNMFLDRLFLAHYDRELHMTASLMGGITWWFALQLFNGVVTYTGTFVAQYDGAQRETRIGATIWQAVYVSLAAGIVFVISKPMWPWVFSLFGHAPELARLESAYCEALCFGAGAFCLMQALGAFYTGRGRTTFVMVVNFVIAGVNILLNWWFIFNPPSWLPFIRPGVEGAAWGTNFAFALGVVIYAAAIAAPHNEKRFHTLRSWRFDPALFRRLVRFGFPQSIHFLLDMAAVTVFALVMGRIDLEAAAATTIAFNLNMLVFHPLVGISSAIGVLVGRFVGAKRPDRAERSTFAGLIVSIAYMSVVAAVFILAPRPLILLFAESGETMESLGRVGELAVLFLAMVGVYSLADALAMAYGGAIKGAGDMKMFMLISGANGVLLMMIPCALTVWLGWSAIRLWVFFTIFIMAYAVFNFLRYRSGAWKSMSVIELESTPAEAA